MTDWKNTCFYPMMNRAMSTPIYANLRKEVLSTASGNILEIGFGSGLNLPYYPADVHAITAVDVSRTEPAARRSDLAVDFHQTPAESLPFPDGTFDTVVSTFTLCSVSDVQRSLAEIRRVLKPGGRFLFAEHGRSWNKGMVWVQHLTNPLYRLFAAGCNVNRNFPVEFTRSGLIVTAMRQVYNPEESISGYYYIGSALKVTE
ncbi:class I SAM-dependent methyltransferase [Leptolinea tardivitalis]|uniref:Methyltransferase type 11 domain-containing protein n=1 Tax=Leptolinea tardivitalis TaxID=229920 RepID=A0A0P6XDR2_9CHLR|nr:class I SAM-dependent methyltransferase [Leptolinea tardivitalis]KPL73295.1 hypothetical protein ADM99_03495 [Leptolinea tardivitalis]GAP21423.1 methylase [Leptolinea tardivitalis]